MGRMPNFRGILKHMDMSARRQDRKGGWGDWDMGAGQA
ncbi:hypothetical protein K376_05991 [Streptomyces sp. PsTaAH-130]|nr:hypothetical protein K376_05991 [Streptomyces sp. PsTaAH-130]